PRHVGSGSLSIGLPTDSRHAQIAAADAGVVLRDLRARRVDGARFSLVATPYGCTIFCAGSRSTHRAGRGFSAPRPVHEQSWKPWRVAETSADNSPFAPDAAGCASDRTFALGADSVATARARMGSAAPALDDTVERDVALPRRTF